jgi:hypothetical protein
MNDERILFALSSAVYFVLAVAIGIATAALCGCASLSGKSVGGAGTVSAIKIETAGSAASGSPLPNVMLGGAAFAVATSPDSERRPIYARAARSSIISRLFGLGMDDCAVVYIGVPDETADETAIRVNALRAGEPVP